MQNFSNLQGAAKSSFLKFFAVVCNRFEFYFEILQLYLLKLSTSDCQTKFD